MVLVCILICVFPLDLWVEDEAVYICEAQNHFGKMQTQARITVTGLGKSSTYYQMYFMLIFMLFRLITHKIFFKIFS